MQHWELITEKKEKLMRKTTLKAMVLTVGVALAAASLAACEKKEGPMEEIGEEVDEAIDNAKKAVD
jgi:hypothetical protein